MRWWEAVQSHGPWLEACSPKLKALSYGSKTDAAFTTPGVSSVGHGEVSGISLQFRSLQSPNRACSTQHFLTRFPQHQGLKSMGYHHVTTLEHYAQTLSSPPTGSLF